MFTVLGLSTSVKHRFIVFHTYSYPEILPTGVLYVFIFMCVRACVRICVLNNFGTKINDVRFIPVLLRYTVYARVKFIRITYMRYRCMRYVIMRVYNAQIVTNVYKRVLPRLFESSINSHSRLQHGHRSNNTYPYVLVPCLLHQKFRPATIVLVKITFAKTISTQQFDDFLFCYQKCYLQTARKSEWKIVRLRVYRVFIGKNGFFLLLHQLGSMYASILTYLLLRALIWKI